MGREKRVFVILAQRKKKRKRKRCAPDRAAVKNKVRISQALESQKYAVESRADDKKTGKFSANAGKLPCFCVIE
jgi:hypothetical protein